MEASECELFVAPAELATVFEGRLWAVGGRGSGSRLTLG